MSEWTRIELSTRSAGFARGLRAALADPLWLLARQWQVGELRGEDAATPVLTTTRVDITPINRLSPSEAAPVKQVAPADPRTTPMEPRVEAERLDVGDSATWRAAEAGMHMLRLLTALGASPATREALRARFPLKPPPGLAGPDRVAFALMARRSLDGAALLRDRALAVRNDPAATTWAGGAGEPDIVRRAGLAFAAWAERRHAPAAAPGMWERDRVEYSFSAAPASNAEAPTLVASEYSDGHLDWYGFDAAPALDLGPRAPAAPPIVREALPVALRFHGMPASRWWSFEATSVGFAGLEGGAEDLPRLLLAGFAAVYSSDWYLVPITLPVGNLARVQRVDVLDSFGRVHAVRSTAEYDHASLRGARPWRFFELKGDPAVARATPARPGGPWLCLPATLAAHGEGRPLEDVELVRDETANLAWAIEHTLEGATGRPHERRAPGAAGEPPGLPKADQPWHFRLGTAVPPGWIPFVPVRLPGPGAQIRLQRARLPAIVDDAGLVVDAAARATVLEPTGRPFFLRGEEVPLEGVRVTRSWQLARWTDGAVHLWIGRRKRPGRGERSAGLHFDAIVGPPGDDPPGDP